MRAFSGKYGIAIIVFLVLAAAVYYWSALKKDATSLGGNSSKGFFVDEENNQEIIEPASSIPPLMGKDGKPTVVRAFKYSCDGGKTSQIYYLLKYTEQAQAEFNNMSVDDPRRPDVLFAGEMVRRPEKGSEWIPSTNAEALTIKSLPECPQGTATMVFPP